MHKLSDRIFFKGGMAMEQPRILFMGTPAFAVAMLEALLSMSYTVVGVVTQPDRFVGRKRMLTPTPVKIAATEAGIPVLQPHKIRDPQALSDIAALAPQLIVTAAYGQILPVSLLGMMPLGAYNVHASLLPKYRGGAPIQRAIMNGEQETGVTIMTMVKAMDAGAMWAKAVVPILPDMTYGQLHDELARQGALLLKDTLPKILDGSICAKEQDPEQATFAPTISRSDELLDFTQTATQVYDHIRALNPQPGAFTYLGDKLLKIWYATPSLDWKGNGTPGQIVDVTAQGPVIACKTGAIVATQVQLEGKAVQTGAEFVRGKRDLTTLFCGHLQEGSK